MSQPTRATSALQFMHRCRQSRTSTQLLQTRHNTSNATPTSPYSPSNFSKPMHRTTSSSSSSSNPTITAPFPSKKLARPTPPPTEIVYPGLKPSLWTSLKMLFGWKPSPPTNYTPAPFNARTNPYTARKAWPPNFDVLHPKQQFHFEKTYRRRAKLAYTRPKWNRRIKTLQHTGILLTVAYFVFICEPEDKMGTPFDGFRAWFFGKLKNLGTLPESTRYEAERLEREARETMKSRRTILGSAVRESGGDPVVEDTLVADT